MFTDLPTAEECQEFLALINKGRAVYDLEPVVKLDYDRCEPGDPQECLSATYLAVPAGGTAGAYSFENVAQADRLADALGTSRYWGGVEIPDGILRVTDPFDLLGELYPGDECLKEQNDALRARLVEAGVAEYAD